MNLENYTMKDLTRGYTIDEKNGNYRCIHCGKEFEKGEIFPIENRFYEAQKAVEIHEKLQHEDPVKALLTNRSKYNTLTENQRKLFEFFHCGMSDKEIARQMGTAVSTVRHQKFTFREKAKQARMYLAVYEGVFHQSAQSDSEETLEKGDRKRATEDIIPIHSHATQVDERYVVTEKEKDHILTSSFSSFEPLRLRIFSPREKKKIVILAKIAEQFEADRIYSEKELNEVLAQIYHDHATLRRYLVDYGFFKREKDGKAYRLTT